MTPIPRTRRSRSIQRHAATVGLAAAVAAVLIVARPDPEQVRQLVANAGLLAPVVFVVLYTGLTVLLVPGAIGSIAAGALFGPVLGTALTVVAASLGATASFLVARALGREQVQRLTGQRMDRLDRWLERRGFLAVVYVRLVPLFPFNVVNYAAGLTAIPTRDYVAATLIGIVPGTIAYVGLGSSITDPSSPRFIASLALVVALALAAPLIERLHASAAQEPAAK